MTDYFVHDTATIESDVAIGAGTRIWHQAHIRTRAKLGNRCIVGKGVFIDFDVEIGDDCKIQNYACVYHGVVLGRGVFIGPHAVFANDMRPRATDPTFAPLVDGQWEVGSTAIGDGASIGANATILPNVKIGRWAMIAAGSTVTRDVPDYALVVGSPARVVGWLCPCGNRVHHHDCHKCGRLPEDHPLCVRRVTVG